MDVMQEMSRRCNEDEMALFGVIARKIWDRRNSVLHDDIFKHPNQIIYEAQELLLNFNAAQETKWGDIHREQELQKWGPPPFGKYKANWDIAIDKVNKCMGMGIIIRDYQGFVQAALCRNISSVRDPGSAEALGVLTAVEFCRDLGLLDIILEGDCLQVIKAIKDPELPWCTYGQVIGDIKLVLHSRRSWIANHVKREAKSAAHGLAKVVLRSSAELIWMEETPPCVNDIVVVERCAL